MSKVLKPLNELPPGQKKPQKFEEMSAKSHRMLVDYGLIRHCHQGSYAYLPLALRSLSKLEHLIDSELSQIDCQKIMLPTMTDGNLWKESGRWGSVQDELFKLKSRRGQDFVLGPTFEEAVTHLIANLTNYVSYKSCPLRLYQVSTKFRDEMRSKFGLLRSKEFIMKDLYTFDISHEAAEETYAQVRKVYEKIFSRLKVPYVSVQGDTGSIGGTISHEYHFISDVGQDELILCEKCGFGSNKELATEDVICPNCANTQLTTSKGIEVGHTFLLGDKYSKVFGAKFMQVNGKPDVLQMGCYGIGVSRILAASLEVLSSETELSWPSEIVPYQILIVAPKAGSKEFTAYDQVIKLYDQLESRSEFRNDVIIDDRPNYTVGKKLREAKQTGYSHIILFGKDCISEQNPVVELHSGKEEMIKLPVNQVMYHFETLYNPINH